MVELAGHGFDLQPDERNWPPLSTPSKRARGILAVPVSDAGNWCGQRAAICQGLRVHVLVVALLNPVECNLLPNTPKAFWAMSYLLFFGRELNLAQLIEGL